MDRNVKELNSDAENAAVGERDRKVVERENSVARTWAIFDVHQGPYLQRWNSIFVISCVFAVSLDPLFFYVVNVDQGEKCLHTDEKLKIVSLVMRSLTDVIFFVHLICEILDSVQKTMNQESGKQTKGNSGKKWEARELIQYARKIAQNMSWLSIIIDILAIVPLPQLIMLMFYPKEGSGFVELTMFVNVFLLAQYVPRIFRIHLSAKVFKRMNGIWARGLFNLFLYILAGHVLGAFCSSRITREITKHLNKSCPLDTPDGDLSSFDFGIFLDSLKNENPNLGKKFLYSFWWGLRNLSNFGTSLVTSTYVWENLFAILISVIGLLLFIYLIGNVQAFMQMGATETEHMRQQRKKKKEAMKTLKKIPMLKEMDEEVLTMMCNYLKPATYVENSFVFRMGDPLDCMLLIIEGTMWTYESSDSHAGQGISSMAIKPLRKGDFYGEELLDWASDFTEVPVSSKHVKSHTKVEAFVLKAEDLVSPLRPHWALLNRYNREELKKTLSAFLRSHTKA
ncbi:hypothetical protein C1H46_009754 [Malus baccata]|uniref:Cyclic nucleotide-binding domain-containing protein n=1 Tax=Malus baccata TaxID=106549 RepID=A0A540N0U1_MALBA|nr:hypothetical protein C1H46_009754 [Malus baccata]